MRQMSWRTRLMLTALVGILTIGLGITAITNRLREELFHDHIRELVRPLVSVLINQIEHNMQNHAPSHFQELLERFKKGKEIHSVYVLDRNKRIVFSKKREEIGTVVSISPEELQDIKKSDVLILPSSKTSSLSKVYTVVKNRPQCYSCHNKDEDIIGYIGVLISKVTEREFEKFLVLYDFSSFFLLFVLFFVIAVYAHRRFFQIPFNQIQKSVKSIEDGNLDTRIRIETPGTLSQLAENINGMTKRLQKARQELDELHRREMNRAGQLATVGELAASVAHEIRNPIAGIRNALDIILDQYSAMQEREIFQEMLVQVERVNKTIQDLMNFARPTEPKFRLIDIHQILRQVVDFYRGQFQQSGVALIEIYDANYSTIRGDEELLKQVFVNILINAYQACSDGKGEVELKTRCNQDKNTILITVKDNGKGILPHQMDKIFKPFFTTKHKGTGLGLSVSRSIVLQHDGEITVDSQPDKGTEFTIELPMTNESHA